MKDKKPTKEKRQTSFLDLIDDNKARGLGSNERFEIRQKFGAWSKQGPQDEHRPGPWFKPPPALAKLGWVGWQPDTWTPWKGSVLAWPTHECPNCIIEASREKQGNCNQKKPDLSTGGGK